MSQTISPLLAVAGLARFGLEARIDEVLAPRDAPPGAGQGALGCRAPIRALGRVEGDFLVLLGVAATDPDLAGSPVTAWEERRGPASEGKELADSLAASLLERFAR